MQHTFLLSFQWNYEGTCQCLSPRAWGRGRGSRGQEAEPLSSRHDYSEPVAPDIVEISGRVPQGRKRSKMAGIRHQEASCYCLNASTVFLKLDLENTSVVWGELMLLR